MQLRKSILVALSIAANAAIGAPVEFDTKAAHVIVVRSVDAWSGDAGVSEDTLDAIRQQKAAYSVVTTYPKTGKIMELDGEDQIPVFSGLRSALAKTSFKFGRTGKSGFRVREPIAIAPADMSTIAQAQSEFYKQVVISQGDPATLPGRVKAKKFFGGVLAVGATFLAMDKFGAVLGSSATLGSGITSDIYAIATKNRAAIAPINLPNLDFSQYKSIDVRKVLGAADRTGQIIIAYKEEKTPEAEQEALILAIVSAAGADTTVTEVEKARTEDLANRIAIWDACVLAGQCKKD
jgi:hypothetical protein